MTTTDAPADYQSSVCPSWPNGASYHAQSSADMLAPGRFAQAEAYVRDWTEALDRAREDLARVQRQIADVVAELEALDGEVTQRPSQAISVCNRRMWLKLRLDSAYLKETMVLLRMRRLEALQEQQHDNRAMLSWQAAGLASPAMGVWQSLLNETRPEMLDGPTQLALAEELAELGLLFDAQDAFIAGTFDYTLGGGLSRMMRDFFFEEIAEPFVQNFLERRSLAAATVRQLVDRWSRERTFETGSAAAIARRMHPLGAPPKSA
ncbi:hypothetical protein GIY62_35150 (plasmid) [Burkholderia plantarii]|uniref:hypothetical protein n=1 Tax=Burkholderia plantarii TaxID=41899 RepID=UPI00272C034F|nr:hypothetical protein [Burkholderia plantarii]WLE64104.1 hypothetical protein GIY62_35150 [Burkholderia plantarii]